MYALEDIRVVHIELTERCNAACPQCPRRTDTGEINSRLTMAELSLVDIERLLEPPFVRRLSKVFFCGNYGDPAAADATLEIARYLRNLSPRLAIGIHTNGSLKSTTWWSELAGVIGDYGYARFAIDGLEDTNHLYRRNTSWSKIMANAAAFIAAGGRAEWDFIVFAHNEHQVEFTRQFAEDAGFAAFHVKRTQRPFHASSGLAPPTSAEFQASARIHSSQISCKAQSEKSIYLSAEGDFYPCCYLAAMKKNQASAETRQHAEILGAFEAHLPSGLLGALESEYFSTVPKLWSGESRLKVCGRVCAA